MRVFQSHMMIKYYNATDTQNITQIESSYYTLPSSDPA